MVHFIHMRNTTHEETPVSGLLDLYLTSRASVAQLVQARDC